MKVEKKDFDLFVRLNGRKYPYSDVRFTRRHFHPQWLLLARPGVRSSYLILPSGALSKVASTGLIISKEALPVPHHLDEILTFMERWGRGEDPVWYRQVVDWIGFVCNAGIRRNYMGIAYDCVALKVRRMLYLHYGLGSTELTRTIFTGWKTFFFYQFEYVTTDFIVLKQQSMEFVSNRMVFSGTAATVTSNVTVVSP
jgi:hypothetical protein